MSAVPNQGARRDWLRHWELWVALVVGAFLRLWQPGAGQFLGDQAGLMQLASLAVQRGAVPVTGIYSSINTLNPPLSVYVLLPFAWLSHDPLLAVISQECWNVAGILFCYIFVLRTFGRRTAAISTILFATAGAAVDYSRLLWQQDYLPPFIALWALFTFAGGAQGRARWLLPATAFLTCAMLLHPTAALLIPTLALALLLCPRKPQRWEYAASGAVVALLLAPTLVWEALSGWVDIAPLRKSFLGGSKMLDSSVFYRLFQVLGGPVTPERGATQAHGLGGLISLLVHTPTTTVFTPDSPYGALGSLPLFIAVAGVALFATGWIVLSHRVFAPLRGVTTGTDPSATRYRRVWSWLSAAWRTVRADPHWRAAALLWVSVTFPPATMIDHSQNVYPHYLLSLFPLLFIVSGIGAVWLLERAGRVAENMAQRNRSARWNRWPIALTGGILALFIVAQMTESTTMIASLAGGSFDGSPLHGYGYLLADLRAADGQLAQAQRTQGAQSIFIVTTQREDAAMAYTFVGNHADRVSFGSSCLLLPSADESPGLVAATTDNQPPQTFLATLPGATRVSTVALAGGAPFALYRVSAPVSMAPGDVPVTPVSFTDGVFALRLDAVALPATGTLRLRWTVLRSTPVGTTPAISRSLASIQYADGTTSHPSNFEDCEPERWHAGETLYTWVGSAHHSATDTLLIGLQDYSRTLDAPRAGPLPLLSALVKQTQPHGATLNQEPGATSGVTGTLTPNWYALPVAKLTYPPAT